MTSICRLAASRCLASPSGAQIEVELTLTSENDFDYVMFEDFKPAGCEPVELQSGYVWGDGLGPIASYGTKRSPFSPTSSAGDAQAGLPPAG